MNINRGRQWSLTESARFWRQISPIPSPKEKPTQIDMGALNIVRVVVHIFASVVTMIAIGFTVASILSSGWQIMNEYGTGEIHQHGLWFDYIRLGRYGGGVSGGLFPAAVNGIATINQLERPAYVNNFNNQYGYGAGYGNGYDSYGSSNPFGNTVDSQGFTWIFQSKMATTYAMDEAHRAQTYQIAALALLSLALIMAVIGGLMSYCAIMSPGVGVGWAICLLLAVVFQAAGLGQYYAHVYNPQYGYGYQYAAPYLASTGLQQTVGYAYYWAVVGVIGYALAMILSIIVCVLLFMIRKQGGKPQSFYQIRRGNTTPV